MVKQVGLLAAGCQPWNSDVCAASGDRFAYSATLAIYIFQLDRKYNEFRLVSIMSEHKKTITAIAWQPRNSDILASASVEHKVIIWDVLKQKPVSVLENFKHPPLCMGWCFSAGGTVTFMSGKGPLYMWSYSKGSSTAATSTAITSLKDSNVSSPVTCFRWHPTKTERVAVGHEDGTVSFFCMGSKSNKHMFRPDPDEDEEDPVSMLEWDPLSPDYLLVCNRSSGLQLVDSVSYSIISIFNLPSSAAEVHTVAWLDSAPGMFVTGDTLSGIVRVWNVSKSSPLENIKVKRTGIHALQAICSTTYSRKSDNKEVKETGQVSSTSTAMAPAMVTASHFALPPAHLICTFLDGGVGVYDLGRRKWNFLRDQGHVETIFDCKFHPLDPDRLATGSFDGTIKLWDISSLSSINTSPGNEGVIYSISWAPQDLNCIAAATSKQGVFIWDINKGNVIKRYADHGRYSVYTVAWNMKDSRQIMSAGSDGYCIIRQVDGEVVQRYKHPAPVYGCDWSPHNKDMLATGCDDKCVRVYYTATSTDQPLKVFSGHSAKVFHVRWSPLKESLLCSGSDDGSIRVWDYSQETCIGCLTGHQGPVRGLLWNTEIPYLLISGSWDSSIRIWDTRDGACIDTVLDHGADVYGLACHPSRPFILASSSRDTTIRLWSLASLAQPIEINLLVGKPWSEILGTPERAMSSGMAPLLTGKESKTLKQEVEEFPKDIRNRTLKAFSKYFMQPSGTHNLWELVSVLQGADDAFLSQNYSRGIMHVKHLTKFNASEAQQLEMVKISRSCGSIGSLTRDEKLREAATIHVKTGNLQRYCELMVELGEWEKALSVAPGVCQEYWQQLARRYAKFLVKEDSDLAVPYCAAIGDAKRLSHFFISRGQMSDAVLTAQVASEGLYTTQKTAKSWKDGMVNGVDGHKDKNLKLLHEANEKHADSYVRNGSPVMAACCHLAVSDKKRAMSRLIQGHELELAVAMGTVLGDLQEYVSVALELLSRRCEHLGKWDLAVDVLKMIPDNQLLLATCCARCCASADEINFLHTKAFLPSLEECKYEAEKLKTKTNTFDCIKYYLLSNEPESGLEIGMQYIKGKLQSHNWIAVDLFDVLQLMGSIRTDRLQQYYVAKLRSDFLTVGAYVGALVAITRRYDTIVSSLLSHARYMLSRDGVSELNISDTLIQQEISAWEAACHTGLQGTLEATNDMSNVHRAVYTELLRKAGTVTSPVWLGPDSVASSHLPSHSDVHVSCLSGQRIQGLAYFLEDGKTAISPNEALMWAKVYPFSPLGSGYRLNPF